MTGIAYNDKLTDPVLTIDDLLDQSEAEGQGHAPERDGRHDDLVMLSNGDDPTKVTDASFNKAFKRIKKAVDSGQIRQFTGNDYAPLARERRPLPRRCHGRATSSSSATTHIHWNLPTDGGALWTDNMLIPKGGNVYTASRLHELRLRPEGRSDDRGGDPKRTYGLYYICPVAGAGAVLEKYDPAIAKNPLIFPTEKMLDNVHRSSTRTR